MPMRGRRTVTGEPVKICGRQRCVAMAREVRPHPSNAKERPEPRQFLGRRKPAHIFQGQGGKAPPAVLLLAGGPRSGFAGNTQNARFDRGSGLLHQAQGPARGQRGPRSQQQATTQTNTGKQPPRARLDPYCRAQRPLFLSHPPWARARHPPQGPKRGSEAPSTGGAGVVSRATPRPSGPHGVGLFAHG